MKKKLSAGLAALALTVAAFSPLGGATSAATAAEFSTMAATACSQTITPSTVTFNVGGSPFAQCYNGTTYFTSGNRTVVKIKTGAYQAYATFQEYGTFRIPANTTQTFNNLLITKLVVG